MSHIAAVDQVGDPLRRSPRLVRWTDPMWIGVLFAIIVGFSVIAGIDLADYNKTKCFREPLGDSRHLLFEPEVLLVLSGSILLALALSGLYYALAACITKQFILTTMGLQVAVSFGAAIFYLVRRRWLTGIFNIVWMLSSIMLYYLLRANIGYATAFLETVMAVAERTPSTIIIATLGAVFSAAWSVLIGSVMMAGFGKMSSSSCAANGRQRPETEFIGLLVYLSVTNYLMGEIIKGVVRFTICVVYGCWYYDTEPAGLKPRSQSQVWVALHAALTYSFGSLCFAGFWLAVASVTAQLLGTMAQMMILNSSTDTTDASVIIIAWVFSHCVAFMDGVLSHFTNYVLVHVALYNHSYIQGAQSAAAVVRSEGRHALVNDFLAGGALTFGSWCIGSLTALGVYVYMWQFTEYPIEGVHFITSYVMIIGAQIGGIFTTGIASGAQTLFVAIIQDPQELQDKHPEFWAHLQRHSEKSDRL